MGPGGVARASTVLALLLIAGACATGTGVRPDAGSATTSTTAPTTTVAPTTIPTAYGGTAVVGLGEWGSPRSLNPFLDGPDLAVLDAMSPALFARGWIADPETGRPVAEVLEEMPSPGDGTVVDNGDGTIDVTVRVRPEARWADGTPITAEDLAFTVEIASDITLPIRSDIADLYALVVPGSVRPSGRELSMRMQATTGYELLFDLILPRHQVEGTDFVADWNDRPWVSGGPFRFGEFVPGQLLALDRNPSYWKTGPSGEPLPYLDRIVFRFYDPGDEPDPRILDAYLIGDLDVVTVGAAQKDLAAYESLDSTRVERAPGRIWEFLSFQFGPGNRNAVSANEYLDFRQAIAHAIDRQALADSRGTEPVTSVLARYGLGTGEGAWDRYPYDLAEVEALLFDLESQIPQDPFAGAGLDVVLTIPGDAPATVEIAGQVVTMLRDAGFDAELQLEDSALFFGSTLDNGSWDVAIWGLVAHPGVTRASAFFESFDPDGLPFVGTNFFRWGTIDSTVSGSAVDDYRNLVEDLRGAVEPSAASILLASAEEILAEQVVLIPLVVRDEVGMAYRELDIEGPRLNPYAGIAWNVSRWRRTG